MQKSQYSLDSEWEAGVCNPIRGERRVLLLIIVINNVVAAGFNVFLAPEMVTFPGLPLLDMSEVVWTARRGRQFALSASSCRPSESGFSCWYSS